MKMNVETAIAEMNHWLEYLERQRERTKNIQELASMARGTEDERRYAQQELRRLDSKPVVYDGAKLEPAVRYAVEVLKEQTGDTQ